MGQKIINNKKVVFFDFPGHPFVHDLTKELSKKNLVYHLYNPKQLGPKSNFNSNINEIIIEIPQKFSRNFYIRFFDEIRYAFLCIYNINKIKPDVLICSSLPLIPLFFVSIFKRFSKFKMVFWMQDIQYVAIQRILKRYNNPITFFVSKLFQYLESFAVVNSNALIFITEDFKKYFNNDINAKKTFVINNWGSFDNIKPLSKINEFSKTNGVDKSFNILYSGTLGYKHNPDLLISLSEKLKENYSNVKLLIVSEGPAVDYISKKAKKNNLSNMVFLPFQDFNLFPQVLASAELSLVFLESDSSEFCVPSKFLSIICAGRIPIVNVDKKNLVAKIINENRCGIVVDNEHELYIQIEDLINNYDKFKYLADNGVLYAKNNFDIEKIALRFEEIISDLYYPK